MIKFKDAQNIHRKEKHQFLQTLFLAIMIVSASSEECLKTSYYISMSETNDVKSRKWENGRNRSYIPLEALLNGLSLLSVLCFLLVLIQVLLMLCGDVEPNPGPTTVTKDDIAWIVKELHSLRHKYVNIGRALHVPEKVLSNIFSRNEPAGKCLQAVIHAWIMSADSVPTWDMLCDALCALGKEWLSDKIRNERCMKNTTDQQGIYVYFLFSPSLSLSYIYIYICTIVHAKIKALLGSTNPMYCTCTRKPFANAAVSAETH